jgi:UDPglucose 6-dehydrogenase
MKIEKIQYTGKVYNIEVEPNHHTEDDKFYVEANTGIVVHNCHPRDNIALRWLAEKYQVGYDLFDTIMHAREIQAKNLAYFLIEQKADSKMPIIIHGKAYKPDVPYCIGSYSTLIGHYLKEEQQEYYYVDPQADDPVGVIKEIGRPSVVLMAHNRTVTYGYTGENAQDYFYCDIPKGSLIVDPWRRMPLDLQGYQVVHYGNTRSAK